MRTQFEELMCQFDSVKFYAKACLDPAPKFISSWGAWLYDWQTLVGGILALIASLIGGGLLWYQIYLQRKQMKQEDRRRAISARIPMAKALSETHSYLRGCYEAWVAKTPETRPDQPLGAMQVIMNAATNVDEETFKTINQLISLFQVFEARVTTNGRVRPSNILDVMIVDIADMAYQTNRLYEFARMEDGVNHVDFAKPKRADLQRTLDNDFDMKLLREESETLLRAHRALDMRFGREGALAHRN